MKTRNKIILSVGTVVLLASGVFAYGHDKSCERLESKSCHHTTFKGKYAKKDYIIKAIMRLDLTSEQRKEIKSIIKEAKQKIRMDRTIKLSSSFSETEFDKNRFMEMAKAKHIKRIEMKAELIAEVYDKLNDIQKKNLKLMLDEFEEKRLIKMDGKHCQR